MSLVLEFFIMLYALDLYYTWMARPRLTPAARAARTALHQAHIAEIREQKRLHALATQPKPLMRARYGLMLIACIPLLMLLTGEWRMALWAVGVYGGPVLLVWLCRRARSQGDNPCNVRVRLCSVPMWVDLRWLLFP